MFIVPFTTEQHFSSFFAGECFLVFDRGQNICHFCIMVKNMNELLIFYGAAI